MTQNNTLANNTQAIITYVLIMVGAFTGIALIIALLMAYFHQEKPNNALQSHLKFQMRTCIIGFIFIAIGTITYKIIIGYFILLFTFVWILVRAAKGLKQLQLNQGINNPKRWFF